MENYNHKIFSLFAGAGGLDIGLEQAGFNTVLATDIELYSCETLRHNKILSTLNQNDINDWFENHVLTQKCYSRAGEAYSINSLRDRLKQRNGIKYLNNATIIQEDIRSLSSEYLAEIAKVKKGELTLIAGGPPCQPFSRSGKRETIEAADGRLFLEFVRVVNDLRPRWFLFENVKGLVQSKTVVKYLSCNRCEHIKPVPFEFNDTIIDFNTLNEKCNKCESNSISIFEKEIRGGSFDIIVNEFERIGYKCFYKLLNSADYGVPQSRERLFIVGSRDNENFVWPQNSHSNDNHTLTQRSLLSDLYKIQKWVTVQDVLWQNGHPKFGSINFGLAVLWVKNVVRPHDEPVTWPLSRVSPTIGAHQGAKLALAPFGVPGEQLLRQQWHVLGKRQKDLPPVDFPHAMLSDEELLSLQTFPNWWYLHGTRMQRAFQIGNAVPPLLAKAVGSAIMAISK